MVKGKSGEWLTVAEVMARLGLSRAAVYKAVGEGRLKGRKVRVAREELRIEAKSLTGFEVSKSHQKRGKRGARIRYGPKR